jgi:multiple sugar transport system ATP-binding protein
MIYVTHDQIEAMTMGTRICIMSGGRVIQVGRPLDVYRAPANTFVASFLGNPPMNLLPAIVADGADGRALRAGASEIALPADRAPAMAAGRAVTFGIRPEHVGQRPQPGDDVARIDAAIERVERLGAETIVAARLPGVERSVFARLPGEAELAVGARCPLYLDLKSAHVFGDDGRALTP